ncbi:hypothetical protein PGT21_031049 [Puccinia graminis f. sp. tritici]|uniref:Uncharacterized protein n=1 Tax=Puccinia graminis f. sp. tritici TaxID=56615 RepID=A0A5B0S3R1_PUCGR|nr:hypothetical protein PGT21_031049 [Puccinia graminis f. sp. tritici]KAA1131354.1 hypothetical protein PGTUg99_032424 [Puccinia graminis f. sp. tritici]
MICRGIFKHHLLDWFLCIPRFAAGRLYCIASRFYFAEEGRRGCCHGNLLTGGNLPPVIRPAPSLLPHSHFLSNLRTFHLNILHALVTSEDLLQILAWPFVLPSPFHVQGSHNPPLSSSTSPASNLVLRRSPFLPHLETIPTNQSIRLERLSSSPSGQPFNEYIHSRLDLPTYISRSDPNSSSHPTDHHIGSFFFGIFALPHPKQDSPVLYNHFGPRSD